VRQHGPCTRGDIASALRIAPPTTSNHLVALETAGLIVSAPPKDQVKNGQWVRYSAVSGRVAELYEALGRELGQIDT
jgi:DNA-binding transcriptional ArsR family regulator